jgi:flagellar assembly protein FliH
MSSKILRGEFEAEVTPIAWRSPAGRSGLARGGDSGLNESGDEASVPEQIRQAYARGLQDGQAALQKQHETEVRPVFERLTETLGAFAELRTRIRRESEEELVELSVAIAKRILHRELTLDPETVRGLVKVAFDRVGAREIKRVRAHPAHGSLLQSLVEKACPDRRVEVVADPAMGSGDIVFETERGDLDASVDSQLEEIRRGLADRLED